MKQLMREAEDLERKSPLSQGARIETSGLIRTSLFATSPLSQGARIETNYPIAVRRRDRSPLSQGARIETLAYGLAPIALGVAPLTGGAD